MADIIEFNSLPAKTQTYLNRLSVLVTGVVPIETKSWKFTTNELQPSTDLPGITAEVAKWAGKDFVYLYVIHLTTGRIDLSKIREAFSKAKSTKKNGRAYPRLNNESSRCFYVGSCSTDMQQRLKQHLGYGAKDTYALQLAHWANSYPLELEFRCAKYRSGLASEVYQALEDTLWIELSPMFGRKGRR